MSTRHILYLYSSFGSLLFKLCSGLTGELLKQILSPIPDQLTTSPWGINLHRKLKKHSAQPVLAGGLRRENSAAARTQEGVRRDHPRQWPQLPSPEVSFPRGRNLWVVEEMLSYGRLSRPSLTLTWLKPTSLTNGIITSYSVFLC